MRQCASRESPALTASNHIAFTSNGRTGDTSLRRSQTEREVKSPARCSELTLQREVYSTLWQRKNVRRKGPEYCIQFDYFQIYLVS